MRACVRVLMQIISKQVKLICIYQNIKAYIKPYIVISDVAILFDSNSMTSRCGNTRANLSYHLRLAFTYRINHLTEPVSVLFDQTSYTQQLSYTQTHAMLTHDQINLFRTYISNEPRSTHLFCLCYNKPFGLVHAIIQFQ